MGFWQYLKIHSRKAGKNLPVLGLGLVSSVPREAPVRAMTGFVASLVKASSFPCSFCPATTACPPFWTCWSYYSGRAFALAVNSAPISLSLGLCLSVIFRRAFHYHPFQKIFFFFLVQHTACGILVPWPGIEPRPWQWKHRVLTSGLPGNLSQGHS